MDAAIATVSQYCKSSDWKGSERDVESDCTAQTDRERATETVSDWQGALGASLSKEDAQTD
jgi:hypothetical protein